MKLINPLETKIIDAHVHIELEPEDQEDTLKEFGIDSSFENLLSQMKQNKIERVVIISETEEDNKKILELKHDKEKIIFAMYVDPFKTSFQEYLDSIENDLKSGNFKAVKLYPGYEYFNPSDEKCRPIFQLAAKYNVPVIIHTGDTYVDPSSDLKPKVRYARPHYVDDVAVDFPKVKIVMAHAGNPWINDAAEIAYKNPNVYLDVSGWFLSNAKLEKRTLEVMTHHLKVILSFVSVDKVLYGSDWPLVKMSDYLNFVKNSVKLTKNEMEKIMYKNALKVYWNK